MNTATHPINHEEVMAFLDGELSTERAAALSSHIASCSDCETLVQAMQGVSRDLQNWEVESGSPQLALEAVLSAEKKSEKKKGLLFGFSWRGRSRQTWILATGAAAAVVLVVAAVVVNEYMGARNALDFYTISSTSSQPERAPSPSPASEATLKKEESSRNRRDTEPAPPVAFARSGDYAYFSSQSPQIALPQLPSPLSAVNSAPMIARTVSLSLVAKDFATSELRVRQIVEKYGGYIGQLAASTPPAATKQFSAILRIPAPKLDAALTEIKSLGRVEKETQSADEVSSDHRDLVARISNSRRSEQRLLDILATRTGKLSDILEAELQISAVRGEIERMDALRKDLEKRVAFATLNLELAEEFKAQLEVTPPSSTRRLHNALVEGYQSAVGSLFSLALLIAAAGPFLLLWSALLFFPARFALRRLRRAAQFAEQRL